ncbi:murein transglycosylase [Salinivibrio sp. ES.052]|uniref:murein transglycosylase n=1 Tax=Salinivibrio sp. ES.052 TaxID=1882823 RepID=UPI00092BF138|nr:murein transglycosylase [Salinivibrio sp. ES.052]SIN73128.1 soluble lytic murein transglycosylase [Salinivibrio sp. ES.052]
MERFLALSGPTRVACSAARRRVRAFSTMLMSGLVLTFGASAPVAFASANPDSGQMTPEQRQYEAAIDAIESGELQQFHRLKAQLRDYPLYPYLDYRDFTRNLAKKSHPSVTNFIQRYATMPFANSLRADYLTLLADRKDWKTLVAFQPDVPRGEQYQCQYYYAHSQAGNQALARSGAKSLYLSGQSVDDRCDPLFGFLSDQGLLTGDLILQRMLLTFEARNRSLMRYLQRQLPNNDRALGKQILALYDAPEQVADFSKRSKVTPFNQKLTRLTFERLARKDEEQAVRHYRRTVEGQHYDTRERQDIADYLIGQLMNDDEPALAGWRDRMLRQTDDDGLLERRFRLALVDGDWHALNQWITLLSDDAKQSLKWRYWQARIKLELGDSMSANQAFATMLDERNFYSVAAAQHLDKPIYIPSRTAVLKEAGLMPVNDVLARVNELIALDKVYAAKREWYYVLQRASGEQIALLAAYAHQNHWYHLAVQATIAGKMWDHLSLRFPLAHQWWFEFFSRERGVDKTTLMALSRQESAFFTRAVSHVGARGLMQLMPRTARETSRQLGFDYQGPASLSDPGVNIRLGSGYLKMMLDRFDSNRILAFAAYNAGPHRVTRWLGRSDGHMDAIAFIESIPFYETRHYVQNVLMFDIYYRQLLGEPVQFLRAHELAQRY